MLRIFSQYNVQIADASFIFPIYYILFLPYLSFFQPSIDHIFHLPHPVSSVSSIYHIFCHSPISYFSHRQSSLSAVLLTFNLPHLQSSISFNFYICFWLYSVYPIQNTVHTSYLSYLISSIFSISHGFYHQRFPSSIPIFFHIQYLLNIARVFRFFYPYLISSVPSPISSVYSVFTIVYLPYPQWTISSIFHFFYLPYNVSSLLVVLHILHLSSIYLPYCLSSISFIFH